MPAKSKKQQRFMGMVHAYQKGEFDDAPKSVKKAAGSMTKKAAKDFAKTKHKGLPEKVSEDARSTKVDVVEDFKNMTFGEFLQLDEGPLAFAMGAGKEIGRKVGQSAPVRAAKDIYAAGKAASAEALKQKALEAGVQAQKVVQEIGPEGEKMLMQLLGSMGEQGKLGARLYVAAKQRAAQSVQQAGAAAAASQNTAATPAAKPAVKPVTRTPQAAPRNKQPVRSGQELTKDAILARRAQGLYAGFEHRIGDKELLDEAIGAFVKGMATAAKDKAVTAINRYAQNSPFKGLTDIWQAGKKASQEADVKKKLQAVAQRLVQFAVALQKAGALQQQQAAPAGA